MKATLRLKKIWLEISAETQKELFLEMSAVTDVFGEEKCGLCQSENIRPTVRVVPDGKKEYTYPEWSCCDCGARLTICQNLEGGGLYPMRKLTKEGHPATGKKVGFWGDHKGWTQYKGDKNVNKDEE